MPVCVPRNNAMPVSTNTNMKTATKCMKYAEYITGLVSTNVTVAMNLLVAGN